MFIGKACEAFVNGVTSKPGSENFQDRNSWTALVASIIAFIIVILILAFIGKYLWNNSLVPLISVARPATSAMQILGLYILAALMFN